MFIIEFYFFIFYKEEMTSVNLKVPGVSRIETNIVGVEAIIESSDPKAEYVDL